MRSTCRETTRRSGRPASGSAVAEAGQRLDEQQLLLAGLLEVGDGVVGVELPALEVVEREPRQQAALDGDGAGVEREAVPGVSGREMHAQEALPRTGQRAPNRRDGRGHAILGGDLEGAGEVPGCRGQDGGELGAPDGGVEGDLEQRGQVEDHADVAVDRARRGLVVHGLPVEQPVAQGPGHQHARAGLEVGSLRIGVAELAGQPAAHGRGVVAVEAGVDGRRQPVLGVEGAAHETRSVPCAASLRDSPSKRLPVGLSPSRGTRCRGRAGHPTREQRRRAWRARRAADGGGCPAQPGSVRRSRDRANRQRYRARTAT